MSAARFDPKFVNELSEILRSEAEGVVYGAKGKAAPYSRLFTGDWELRSVGIEPDSAGTRVICRLQAQTIEVIATIGAAEFPNLVGNRARAPAFNSPAYTALAFLTSPLIP